MSEYGPKYPPEYDWDACDQHETTFLIGATCPECDKEDKKKYCEYRISKTLGWWDTQCHQSRSSRGWMKPQGDCVTCGKEIKVIR